MKLSAISLAFLLIVGMRNSAHSGVEKYTLSKRTDGGYDLTMKVSKRHWQPITAEGFFPLEERYLLVSVKGRGERWDYRNQKGTYYKETDVYANSRDWDIGFAWIDDTGENLYLNFYRVSPPDDLKPSDVNGRYPLK